MIEAPIAVKYVDHMGSDVNVVNAARVSFAKEVQEFSLTGDTGLLRYLAKHNHWSPFAHTCITVRCKVPLFIARQLVKHQVGGNWNEESRRYIDTEPEFYFPDVLHTRPDSVKQGSGYEHDCSAQYLDSIRDHSMAALELYQDMLLYRVAPEEARMVLPLNTMTNFMWTGSLLFMHRVISQRIDAHAQLAAQEFAKLLQPIIYQLYPNCWGALNEQFI